MQGIDATIILHLKIFRLGVVAHTFTPSIQDAEGGRCFEGQCGLHSKFQGSQVYIERFCLKQTKKLSNPLQYKQRSRNKKGTFSAQ